MAFMIVHHKLGVRRSSFIAQSGKRRVFILYIGSLPLRGRTSPCLWRILPNNSL